MRNMLRHIEYLVIRHDCVIVPGLGAFIAAFEPARVEDGRILPPCRLVRFNPDIIHNDGLLASSIARREGIGYDMAVASINENVVSIKTQLAAGGRLTVGRVGCLSASGNGTLAFYPDEDNIASLRFRGLPEVVFDTEAAPGAADECGVETYRRSNIIYVPVHKAIIRAAVSIALLVGVGLLCSTPNIVDDTAIMASLNPGTALRDVAENFKVREDTFAGELAIAVPESKYEATQKIDTIGRNWYQKFMAEHEGRTTVRNVSCAKEEMCDASAKNDNTAFEGHKDEYCVVVASLPTLARAQKWVGSRGDSSLKILPQDGRYRVYITTADTEEAAKSIASSAKMQHRYPGAWVTRR